jgi:hypothetical protein
MPDKRLPGPLAELGDIVEVEVLAAPGGKDTELRARRAAPREAKQLIEAKQLMREHHRQPRRLIICRITTPHALAG